MDKHEAATVLQNAILEDMVLAWPDCKRLEAGIQRGLEEIDRRRQEAGPEAIEMVRPRCCSTKGQKKNYTSPL